MRIELVVPPIQVNLHISPYQNQSSAFGELKAQLVGIASTLNILKGLTMATKDEFEAGFARLNTATNAVAEVLRKHVEAAKAGNMSAAEEAESLQKLSDAAGALEAMAGSPVNPVPVDVPAPIEVPPATGGETTTDTGTGTGVV